MTVKMDNNIKRDFTITPNALINDENLSSIARFLFVWLCSKPENWKYHNSVIEKSLNFGKDSRIKYMKELIESGWITVRQQVKDDGTFGLNDIYLNPRPEIPHTEKSASDEIRVGQIPTLNKTDLKSNTNKDNKTDLSLFSKDEMEPISKMVIRYLNEKKDSKKPFEFTASNLAFVEARIKEGFKFEDFKSVVDFKISEWKPNEKMKKYIRPETLFGTKFNGYLVEANEPGSNVGSDNFEYSPKSKAEML